LDRAQSASMFSGFRGRCKATLTMRCMTPEVMQAWGDAGKPKGTVGKDTGRAHEIPLFARDEAAQQLQ
jgi:hypothetical protein